MGREASRARYGQGVGSKASRTGYEQGWTVVWAGPGMDGVSSVVGREAGRPVIVRCEQCCGQQGQ